MSGTNLRTRAASTAGLAATCVLALTACSTADGATGDDGYTIGFVNGANNEWGTCLEKGVEAGAGEAGVELLVANSDTDPAKEVSNVEDMIARGVDAIVLNTVSVDTMAGGIASAQAADVPVYLAAIMPENLDDVLGATVVDLAGVGELAAGWIDDDADGEDVDVAIVAGAPGASSDYVVQGFADALPANVSVVAEQPGMFNRGKAQEVTENIVQASPDVDYLFVLNEDMAFGVRAALDAAGSDAAIVTTNGTDPGLDAVGSGDFAATVADSAADLGRTSVEHTVALLDDPDGEQVSEKPVSLITQDNLEEAPSFCG